jgi:membrane-bound lytic murein transglycosylase D
MSPTISKSFAIALLGAVPLGGAARGEEGLALAAVTFVMPERSAPKVATSPAAPSEPGTGRVAGIRLAAPVPPTPAPPPEGLVLHKLALTIWEEAAPGTATEEHELLPPEEFANLVQRLCAAGQSDDLGQLAGFAPEARRAIASLRARPGFEDYAAWLANQLDEIDAAEAARNSAAEGRSDPAAALFTPPPSVASFASSDPASPPPVAEPRPVAVPYYELWLDRMAERPRPSRADQYLPSLRAAFVAEGVPSALVWLAETESSFNPRARNPVGARGLFQIMPETARSLGLGLWPDERVHPVRSAHAAAAYLRYLHGRFGDWPLALAAYNAGEGRVSRELKRRDASDFAAIARHLPAETRLYVPKVLATIQVREGVHPDDLPAPELVGRGHADVRVAAR